jgi:nitrogen fixation/metabolism regulation signal transduction histidine kinase
LLILVSAGYVITRTLTRPLQMLQQKLEQTRLGLPNERIEWQSKDEIGRIIDAYNTMLEKLEESEKKLTKNEREIAWREMARQVAHEIKNPLTPMRLSIQHLVRAIQQSTGDPRPMVERISGTLLTQIDSLTSIANSFSQFATLPTDVKEPTDLIQVLQEVNELYGNAEEAEIIASIPEEPLYIWAEKNRLTRVFVNLIRNALQAMPERGRIEIGVEVFEKKCRVSFRDNGSGIPEAIQARIFEPNFSTKSSGMGLGLAITKRMVESFGGTIDFESQENIGTIFWLEFSRCEPKDSES